MAKLFTCQYNRRNISYNLVRMSKMHEFNVDMTCEGCSHAVERVLGKKSGIDNVRIDLVKKKVFVTSSLSSDEIIETLKKTGKPVSYVGVQK